MVFSLNCLLWSFLYLLIVKNNQASACTERLANAEPMVPVGRKGQNYHHNQDIFKQLLLGEIKFCVNS